MVFTSTNLLNMLLVAQLFISMMSIWMATELNVQIESEYMPEYLELRNNDNIHGMVDVDKHEPFLIQSQKCS